MAKKAAEELHKVMEEVVAEAKAARAKLEALKGKKVECFMWRQNPRSWFRWRRCNR
jgi:hypothetical protein